MEVKLRKQQESYLTLSEIITVRNKEPIDRNCIIYELGEQHIISWVTYTVMSKNLNNLKKICSQVSMAVLCKIAAIFYHFGKAQSGIVCVSTE